VNVIKVTSTGSSSEPSSEGRRRFVLEIDGGAPILADRVVLAVPANRASRLLSEIDSRASEVLGAIPHASSAVVFIALREEDVQRKLDATGYIVPRTLGSKVMAATWVTSKWDGRAPAGKVLLRVFLGGSEGDEIVTRDDAALVGLALTEIRGRMGITGKPLFTRVLRFARASAQPLVGHLDRIAEVSDRLSRLPGLFVAGSGYDGVGIPDCIRQAEKVAAAVA
jgi:oxygen-dependent protoporphyrinogen oxidase